MLSGKNVFLRALAEKDWEKTIAWRNDPNIKKLAMMHPFPITEMNEREWYNDLLESKSDKTIYFAIDVESELIGFVFLDKINRISGNCALGIVIGDENIKGKGYGKDAMNTILKYAFETLNLRKVTLEVLEINDVAVRLYKSLGFQQEGRLKEHFFAENTYFDVLILSLFNGR